MSGDVNPAGFSLVPHEPTEAMLEAAGKAFREHTGTIASLYLDMWSAMLAAAPKVAS